ncbi:MAG: serine protease [Pirellulaceae bacterium]|nr:serine protease [Pirellulaceae bacterium]
MIVSACLPSAVGRLIFALTVALMIGNLFAFPLSAQPPLDNAATQTQKRVVKIYGAGGLAGLEAYQSGFLVSPEGHVATAWSYVLDVDPVVILDDGRRFESKIVGFEPSLELAVLKIDASALPYFTVSKESTVQWGDPVIAVSNLFGIATGNEPASVMHGSVAAVTELDARRGTFKTPYRGKVLILDLIANNPGAAGGAVVNAKGELVGMLGKELRDAATGVWLNYALPSDAFRSAIGDIIAGRKTTVASESDPMLDRNKSHNLETLGLVMIPDVLETTPAYVDDVIPKSAAARAGVRPDDLILLIDGRRIENQRSMRQLLRSIDRRDEIEVTVKRDIEIVPMILRP